jgi:hypothetical protein
MHILLPHPRSVSGIHPHECGLGDLINSFKKVDEPMWIDDV